MRRSIAESLRPVKGVDIEGELCYAVAIMNEDALYRFAQGEMSLEEVIAVDKPETAVDYVGNAMIKGRIGGFEFTFFWDEERDSVELSVGPPVTLVGAWQQEEGKRAYFGFKGGER